MEKNVHATHAILQDVVYNKAGQEAMWHDSQQQCATGKHATKTTQRKSPEQGNYETGMQLSTAITRETCDMNADITPVRNTKTLTGTEPSIWRCKPYQAQRYRRENNKHKDNLVKELNDLGRGPQWYAFEGILRHLEKEGKVKNLLSCPGYTSTNHTVEPPDDIAKCTPMRYCGWAQGRKHEKDWPKSQIKLSKENGEITSET